MFATGEGFIDGKGVAAGVGVFVDRVGVNEVEDKVEEAMEVVEEVSDKAGGGARPVGGSTDFNQQHNRGSPFTPAIPNSSL